MPDLLFDDKPLPTTDPPAKARKRMPNPVWNWVERRFFASRVASGQSKECGRAVKLFSDKGLGPAELEARFRRLVEKAKTWPDPTPTLHAMMNHIDSLAAAPETVGTNSRIYGETRKWEKQWAEGAAAARIENAASKAECEQNGHDGDPCGRCMRARQRAEGYRLEE